MSEPAWRTIPQRIEGPRLGSDVGTGTSSGRYARLVAILRGRTWDDGSRMRYLFRRYVGDEPFPTGTHYRGDHVWLLDRETTKQI